MSDSQKTLLEKMLQQKYISLQKYGVYSLLYALEFSEYFNKSSYLSGDRPQMQINTYRHFYKKGTKITHLCSNSVN